MMERPQQREINRSIKRRAILDLARSQFFEHGYAATSMSKISSLLGGSKGTLWSYFPSKNALFAATVQDAAATLHADLQKLLKAGSDAEESLVAFAERFVEKITIGSSIQLQRLVVGEAGRFPEIGKIFFEQAFEPVHRQLSAFLASEMRAGKLLAADPVRAAFELISLLQRYQQLLLWNLPGTPMGETILAHCNASVASFLRAYRVAK